ncbi:MAG: Zn-dependent protease [Fibrobacteria bacterium]|nr:Zn-dependent protease [Fibrobacteria bacterium]
MKFFISLLLWLVAIPIFSQSKISIALQSFNNFPSSYIDSIKTGIEQKYGKVKLIVLPNKKLPTSAYYKPRNRYRAEKILTFLDTLVTGDTKIVGLTTLDISTTNGKYKDWGIFGLGEINARPCVVSTFRLKKKNVSSRLFIQRLVKIVNHELGHTFGFEHCPFYNCLMEDAKGTIKTVDKSDGNFCKKCRILLMNHVF